MKKVNAIVINGFATIANQKVYFRNEKNKITLHFSDKFEAGADV